MASVHHYLIGAGNIAVQIRDKNSCIHKEYRDKHLAALRIQRCWRGHRVRKNQQLLNSSAIIIQKYVRGYLARLRLPLAMLEYIERQHKLHYHKMATRIQSLWRGYLTRKNKINVPVLRGQRATIVSMSETVRELMQEPVFISGMFSSLSTMETLRTMSMHAEHNSPDSSKSVSDVVNAANSANISAALLHPAQDNDVNSDSNDREETISWHYKSAAGRGRESIYDDIMEEIVQEAGEDGGLVPRIMSLDQAKRRMSEGVEMSRNSKEKTAKDKNAKDKNAKDKKSDKKSSGGSISRGMNDGPSTNLHHLLRTYQREGVFSLKETKFLSPIENFIKSQFSLSQALIEQEARRKMVEKPPSCPHYRHKGPLGRMADLYHQRDRSREVRRVMPEDLNIHDKRFDLSTKKNVAKPYERMALYQELYKPKINLVHRMTDRKKFVADKDFDLNCKIVKRDLKPLSSYHVHAYEDKCPLHDCPSALCSLVE